MPARELSETIVRPIIGLEGERIKLRSFVLRVIREVMERPRMSDKDCRRDWLKPPPLSAFQNLEPLGFGRYDDDRRFFVPEDCKPDLVWPINVGVIAERSKYDNLTFGRMRSITPKEARGYATRFSPFMVRYDHASVTNGQLLTCASLLSWIGGQWVDSQVRTVWDSKGRIDRLGLTTNRDEGLQAQLMTSVALTQRYEWAASFALPESPSIRIATDPTGIKEFFKLRDIPEGKDRREALMTWVTDHWRQDRKDPDIELYVRKHLRGATKFEWGGFNCEILPSLYDIERRDILIAERAAMRQTGEDRRPSAAPVTSSHVAQDERDGAT